MELHKLDLADLLGDLGLQYGKCTIKEIVARCDSYIPCAGIRELEAALSVQKKTLQNLAELSVEGSKIR